MFNDKAVLRTAVELDPFGLVKVSTVSAATALAVVLTAGVKLRLSPLVQLETVCVVVSVSPCSPSDAAKVKVEPIGMYSSFVFSFHLKGIKPLAW